ncbi:unnamed protein product, partial [Linum tenue]
LRSGGKKQKEIRRGNAPLQGEATRRGDGTTKREAVDGGGGDDGGFGGGGVEKEKGKDDAREFILWRQPLKLWCSHLGGSVNTSTLLQIKMGSLRSGNPVCCQQQFPRIGACLLRKTGDLRISRSASFVRNSNDGRKLRATLSVEELPPNAFRRKNDPRWRGGFSLGVDLGLSRTGIALSKGFTVRPLMVLEMRGQKLELRLLEIAEREEVDEFIVGLPRSSDSKETPQSNKVRSVAGRLAARAAERGWRVYLQDEHGTTTDAMNRMINTGLDKETRQKQIDAYAAVMVLERYFSRSGSGTELVVPKQLDLQDKLRKGPPKDIDFYPDE